MIFYICFLFFIIFFIVYIYKKINYKKEFIFLIFFFFLYSTLFSVLYCGENYLIWNRLERPGDTTFYLNGGYAFLSGKFKEMSYHYFYDIFLSLFLWHGNVLIASLGQQLLLLLTYLLSLELLLKFNVNKLGFLLFSVFILFNGNIVGVFVATKRDGLMLFSFVLAFYSFFNFIFTRKLKYLFFLIISLVIVSNLRLMLSFILLFIFILSFFITLKYKLYFKNKSKLYLIFLLLFIGIILLLFYYKDYIVHVFVVNYLEHTRLKEEISNGSNISNSPLVNSIKFIFGPGIIRPLFPEEFFLSFTYTYSFFYWIGQIWWYTFLLLTLPLFIRKPFLFLKKHPVLISIILFVFIYIEIYAFAGSGLGMRKKMVMQFFYALFIILTYFSNKSYNEIIVYRNKIILKGLKLDYRVLLSLILIFYLFITYKGIQV